jgi:hypothetical protein
MDEIKPVLVELKAKVVEVKNHGEMFDAIAEIKTTRPFEYLFLVLKQNNLLASNLYMTEAELHRFRIHGPDDSPFKIEDEIEAEGISPF